MKDGFIKVAAATPKIKVADPAYNTEEILKIVSDFKGKFNGAFNIREDGQCAGRQSSKDHR